MMLSDYDAVYDLWLSTEYMCLNECDTRDGIALYLQRNKGLCFVAVDGDDIIGTVLCGHDGRRGFLRHLAVQPDYRRCGVAGSLVRLSMDGLMQQGIGKCNIFVEDVNADGIEYWLNRGWKCLDYTFRMLQNNCSAR